MTMRVGAVRKELAGVMADFDPRVVDAQTAAKLVKEFGAIERMAAAGRALAAGRVAETRVWAESGDRSPARWLAKTSGTSVGQAAAALATARNLEGLAATAEAFRAGELSLEQAGEIARAASADPHAEEDLLSTAATAGVAGLRTSAAASKPPRATKRSIGIRRSAQAATRGNGWIRRVRGG